MSFGQPFAAGFGGGGDQQSPLEIEYYALLDAYAPGWTSDETTQSAQECRALAIGLATIWMINQRCANIMVPQSMLESLTTWEQACSVRPTQGESIQARRAAIAARFLGFAGNTVNKIYDICATMAGNLFVGIATVPKLQATTYCPGISLGHAGAIWYSNRCTIGVQVMKAGVTDQEFFDLLRRLRLELSLISPAWLTFYVGTFEGGFVSGIGVAGLTFL